jgi:putative DNA primase/helicase
MIQINELKQTITKDFFLAVVESEGLKTKSGRCQCPELCSDDARSCSISDNGQGALWSCHRCNKGGSIIDFIALRRNISINEAIKWLNEEKNNIKIPNKIHILRPPMNGAALWEKLTSNDPPTEEYLKFRGLDKAIPHVKFNTGKSGDKWLDSKATLGYRLAVPLRDESGSIIDFQLRAINQRIIGADSKRSLVGVRPRGTAFGRPDLARAGGRVYVAEGMADTLALIAAGMTAIGAPGCDQLVYLSDFLMAAGIEIVFCVQNDAKGQSQNGFNELHKKLGKKKVLSLITPNNFKDIAEWRQSVGGKTFDVAIQDINNLVVLKKEENKSEEETSTLPLTDYGNAERLAKIYGDQLKWSQAYGWSIWDGARWTRDDTGEHMRMAKSVARSIALEPIKNAGKQAKKAESAGKLKAMLDLAASEKNIAIKSDSFDKNPWVVNCKNGTIDLKTGQLRPHHRNDMCSKLIPFNYEPTATAPRWEQFLTEVQPDKAIREFLQRLIGYSLTGIISEHILIILHGGGRNGKSVFTTAVLNVLGDYGVTVPSDLIMSKVSDSHPTEIMTLCGRRLAICSETNEEKSLNIALVKNLTGGDNITARLMRHDFVTFAPTHKLILMTNNVPKIKETSDAIWGRVKLIPWSQCFPEDKQDKKLSEKLLSEREGILSWAVKGCLEWQRIGLSPPSEIASATAAYRRAEDCIGDFLAERCLIGKDYQESVQVIRSAYEKWSENQGERYPMSPRAFNARLETKGFERRAGRNKLLKIIEKTWFGLTLLPEEREATIE